MVLVDGNPFTDISNLGKRSGVMIRGKWLSQDYIEEKLARIAENYGH